MAYCHIAHNCVVGNYVIMSNNATLAGHVTVEDYAIIGGFTPIHQFSRIGCYAMVGGMSRVTHDIPPYLIGGGVQPFKYGGLNIRGLQRHNIPLETRRELNKAFKILFKSRLHLDEALKLTQLECASIPEIQHWIKFCQESKRGILGLQGVVTCEEADTSLQEEDEKLSLAEQRV
jgi:UDP-N-acetylglucosamine acyltransferase